MCKVYRHRAEPIHLNDDEWTILRVCRVCRAIIQWRWLPWPRWVHVTEARDV